jgi:phosphatidylserine/phosphatidylglycerophosphate/cardiolipin synthase-like enzyme
VVEAAKRGPNTVKGDPLSQKNRLVEGPISGGEAITDAIVKLVASAKKEVLLEFFDFDERSWMAGKIKEAVLALPDTVQVRVLIPPFPFRGPHPPYITESEEDAVKRLTDFFARPNVKIGALPRTGFLGLGTLHSRQIVVDGARVLVTDANVQWNTDPVAHGGLEWNQLAIVVEGEIGATFRQEIASAWERSVPRGDALPPAPSVSPAASCTPMALFGRDAGAPHDAASNRAIGALARSARRVVRVISPNLNDDGALAALADATEDATVRVVLSKGFNDATESYIGQGGTNAKNVERLAKMARDACKLQIRWYARDAGVAVEGNGRYASHSKLISADGQAMVFGSQNMDTQSWKSSRELNLFVDDAATVSKFDAAFDAIWDRSPVAFDARGGAGGERCAR